MIDKNTKVPIDKAGVKVDGGEQILTDSKGIVIIKDECKMISVSKMSYIAKNEDVKKRGTLIVELELTSATTTEPSSAKTTA